MFPRTACFASALVVTAAAYQNAGCAVRLLRQLLTPQAYRIYSADEPIEL
jgi:hypothetical protein